MKTYACRYWLFCLGFMLSLGAAQAAYASCDQSIIDGYLINETSNNLEYVGYSVKQGATPSITVNTDNIISAGANAKVFSVCSEGSSTFSSPTSSGRLQFLVLQGTDANKPQLATVNMNYDGSTFQCALNVETPNGVSFYQAACPQDKSDVTKCTCTLPASVLSAILTTYSPTDG